MRYPSFRSANIARKLLLALVCLAASAAPVFSQSDERTQEAIEFFNKGQDAHEKGDLTAALKLYEQAIEIIPDFPEAELQRGLALAALKRTADAEIALRKALELREDWTLAMASLGSLLVELGKYDEAGKLLTSAIAADDSNSLAVTALADLRIKTDAGEPALREVLVRLTELAGKVRPTATLLSMKSAVELKLGDRAAAKRSAARALEIDPKLGSANMIAAEIAIKENDLKQADIHIARLEASDPKDPETVSLKARVLFARGKKQDALALLGSISSPSPAVLSMIAEIKDGDIVDLAGLEAKVKRTPDDANALARLCQGYRVSDPMRAVEYCRRASVVEPNEISHAVGFGAALVQAKRYDEAVGLFRKLLTLSPEHATIRANLATALFQLKRYPEAKAEFRWLTEKQPESPAAYYFLAIAHDQLGEYLDAMANYQQFLRLADAEKDKLEIEKVNLRLPAVQKQIKNGKGRKRE